MTQGGPRIVIAGAGFGGLFAARSLADAPARVLLIDRQNYHLFQPLLYQVATAGLAPSDIAWPIRSIMNGQSNTSVLLGNIQGVDRSAREILLESTRIPYDFLVLATGARHAYFGHEEWRTFAPGLKSIDDATALRRSLLAAFEQAEMSEDSEQRRRLLQFAIVGGGPTGVELAGAIAELAHYTLARDFRRIDPRSARVALIEAGPRLLPAFSEGSSAYARESLRRLQVEVRVNSRVMSCDANGITIGEGHREERMEAGTVIWAAGVAASPIGKWLDLQTDAQGRIPVGPDLAIEPDPHVFVIGDAARVIDGRGQSVPGTAPAAKQQGRYVARVLRSRIERGKAPPAFRYKDVGNLATIGRRSAVVEFGRVRLKGRLAWWLWGIAHIYFLIGLPSPIIVSLRWLWEYMTYGKGARLITGDPGRGES